MRASPAVLVLGVLTGLGLAARLWLSANNPWPSVDGVYYMSQARDLVRAGQLPFSTFPPGWPLIIAVPLLLMDLSDPYAPLRAAHLANSILGTLAPVLAFILARQKLNGGLAFAVAALLSFLPHNLILAKSDLSEMSYTCATLGGCLLLASRRHFLAGLLLGFAYLIRPEALATGAAISLWLLFHDRKAPLTLWLGIAISVAPYVVYLHAQTGNWVLSGKTVFLSTAWEKHPGLQMVGLYGRNAGALLPMLPGIVGLPLCVLAVVGAVTTPGVWLLFLLPVTALPLFAFGMDPRYWVPYVPFLAYGAALGAAGLAKRWCGPARRVWKGRAVQHILSSLLLTTTLGGFVIAARDEARLVTVRFESYLGLRDAGLWLRDRVRRDTLIADQKPYAAYWADCQHVRYPDGAEAASIIDAVRRAGAEYLIANVFEVVKLKPALLPLLSQPLPAALETRLTCVQALLYSDESANTLIYKITDPHPGPGVADAR